MNNKSTSDNIVKELNEIISTKDSTILFLMNFARVYSYNNYVSVKDGHILN